MPHTKQPLVFIVVPVYNRELSLEYSINSIINQTFTNWKLMIIDDNSNDRTPDIIQKLKQADSRIHSKINHEYSHSPAGARKSGLLKVDEKYVAFLDSDDTWPDYHLQNFIDILEKNSELDYIFGDIMRVDQNGNILTSSKFIDEKGLPEQINIEWSNTFGIIADAALLNKAIKYRFVPGFHTAVFKSSFLKTITIQEETKIGEDFLFALETFSAKSKIGVSKDVHLFYSVHENNISNVNAANNYEKSLNNTLEEIQLLEKIIPRRINLTKKEALSINHRLSDMYVWHLGNLIYRSNKKRRLALNAILKGISLQPFNFKYWKTFLATLLS